MIHIVFLIHMKRCISTCGCWEIKKHFISQYYPELSDFIAEKNTVLFQSFQPTEDRAFSITTDDSSVAVIVPSTGHLGNVEINNVEICLVFNEDVSHLAAKSANRGVNHPVHQQTAESDSVVETWFVWKLWKVFSTWKAHCIVHVEFDTWSREPEKLRQAPFLPVTPFLCFRRITANRWWEAERLQRYLHFHSMRIIILMYSQTT